MVAYIRSIGIISPQPCRGENELMNLKVPINERYFRAIEPNYEDWLNARSLRRMSRILKMGVTSAVMALKDAGIDQPDAIITGTGYGCLEDTGTFLSTMISNDEISLNPTPFIQSTHNSIGSAVALLYDCRNYNQTYSQGPVSFECSVMDALLLIREKSASLCLVGAIDELTETSISIFESVKKISSRNKNSIAVAGDAEHVNSSCVLSNGEGAAYFVLSADKSEGDCSCIVDVKTLFEPDPDQLKNSVSEFLSQNKLNASDIDLVLSGFGGITEDHELPDNTEQFFPQSSLGYFKQLCGEYHSASAFAVWLASRMISEQFIPENILIRNCNRRPKSIVVFNQSGGSYYSLILVQEC